MSGGIAMDRIHLTFGPPRPGLSLLVFPLRRSLRFRVGLAVAPVRPCDGPPGEMSGRSQLVFFIHDAKRRHLVRGQLERIASNVDRLTPYAIPSTLSSSGRLSRIGHVVPFFN